MALYLKTQALSYQTNPSRLLVLYTRLAKSRYTVIKYILYTYF